MAKKKYTVQRRRGQGDRNDGLVAGYGKRHGRPRRFQEIVEAVAVRDREWFAAHPGESHCVRPYVPGEFWPKQPNQDLLVLVTCYRDPSTGIQLQRVREAIGWVTRKPGNRMTVFDPETGRPIAEGVIMEGVEE